jgi:peptidyl-prolyl cis-trans isomerase SurA
MNHIPLKTGVRLGRLLAAVLLVAGMPAQAQNLDLSDTGVRIDGIAAVVNDGVVLLSELEEQTALIIQRLQADNTPLPPQNLLIEQILERLVLDQIQLQRAERYGIQIPDEALNRALSDIARRNETTLANLPQLLARDGIDYLAFRQDMRRQMTIEQLRQRDVVSRISVTPRELEDYLEREENSKYRNLRYKISHILIAMPSAATPDDINSANKSADDIYEQLAAGADFAELAVAYSDAQNALEGGDLDWRDGESLPSLFAGVVPEMEIGDISKPFRSSSGFHLVKVDNIEGGKPIIEDQVHARHILMKTNEILDNDNIRQKLEQIRAGILGGDEFESIAKAVSEDPGSAINGGDLGWAGPGTFVPAFEAVVSELEIDQISEPFQSPFGWHIVQLLELRTHDKTEDVKRERGMIAIRDGKIVEETELWLRQMRDESFIEYRL